MENLISIRNKEGAAILDFVNCAAISERFFNRSRAWFTQRLNNNIVNGKPISFTPEELLKLRTSLKVLALELTEFSSHIPNIPTDMAIKVYVIEDRIAIDYIQNDDLEGFKDYIASDLTLDFGEPAYFDTEAEALAFCAGLGYGQDERGIPDRYPLRSSEESDQPFIKSIESHL
ncbi:MAG: DUF5053 domain-containing protein [Bacteroides sp.]|nr:DUF5053 domain-containing protein [Bacteroides sp.]